MERLALELVLARQQEALLRQRVRQEAVPLGQP